MQRVAINSSCDELEGRWVLDAGCEKIAKEFKAGGEMPKKIITLLDRPESLKRQINGPSW